MENENLEKKFENKILEKNSKFWPQDLDGPHLLHNQFLYIVLLLHVVPETWPVLKMDFFEFDRVWNPEITLVRYPGN